jgi:hypothetical protein
MLVSETFANWAQIVPLSIARIKEYMSHGAVMLVWRGRMCPLSQELEANSFASCTKCESAISFFIPAYWTKGSTWELSLAITDSTLKPRHSRISVQLNGLAPFPRTYYLTLLSANWEQLVLYSVSNRIRTKSSPSWQNRRIATKTNRRRATVCTSQEN